jgi:pimeloyl-ACP methyl ester carboxylesterase
MDSKFPGNGRVAASDDHHAADTTAVHDTGSGPGSVEYDERGGGPAVVLVPGSCSTGAAWRSVVAHLDSGFRCITTSLLGYGDTDERRSAGDVSISHECRALEHVIARAGGRVHLVGHSFGGLVSLAVALRGQATLASLTIFEAPAVGFLRGSGDDTHFDAFRRLTDGYFAAYRAGNQEAISAMIDFYGGPGTFASWPSRTRSYAIEKTPVNMLDWASAYGFDPSASSLSALDVPTHLCVGATSHPAVQRANEVINERVPGSTLSRMEGAAHFMIATHPEQVARIIADRASRAEAAR